MLTLSSDWQFVLALYCSGSSQYETSVSQLIIVYLLQTEDNHKVFVAMSQLIIVYLLPTVGGMSRERQSMYERREVHRGNVSLHTRH